MKMSLAGSYFPEVLRVRGGWWIFSFFWWSIVSASAEKLRNLSESIKQTVQLLKKKLLLMSLGRTSRQDDWLLKCIEYF